MTLTIAVSGGADSVALLRAVHRVKPASTRLIVAHYNHGLRGEASNGDAAFVEQLSQELECPFRCNSTVIERSSMAQADDEEGLRQVRYEFLHSVACSDGARYLVTAHTLDDQAETVLFQLLRGTGTGLTGIRPFRESRSGSDLILARPLLNVPRAEVVRYLEGLGQTYRHDQSNDSRDYSRNWIRHELLPMIDQRIPGCRQAVARSASTMLEFAQWNETQALSLFGTVLLEEPCGGLRILVAEAGKHPWFTVQVGLKQHWTRQGWPLRDMSHEHWQKIRNFIELPYERRLHWNLPANLQMIRHRDSVQIEPLNSITSSELPASLPPDPHR